MADPALGAGAAANADAGSAARTAPAPHATVADRALAALSEPTDSGALHAVTRLWHECAGSEWAAACVLRPDAAGLVEFAVAGTMPAGRTRARCGAAALDLVRQLGDARSEPLIALADDAAAAEFTDAGGSLLAVPVRRDSALLGAVLLIRPSGAPPFTQTDSEAAAAIVPYTAIAMQHLLRNAHHESLVRALISAQEEERRRVAFDLHDGLTQFVMASHAHIETFRRLMEADQRDRAMQELENGLRYLKEAVIESRRLVNGLRSLALDDLGLAGALEQLLNEEKARAGWSEAYLVHNTADETFDKVLATAVFRIAQEALTNARKHAAARRVRIMLLATRNQDGNRLTLEVRDWGRGFDTTVPVSSEEHVGLESMLERARLLDGTLSVQSTPGVGTVIRAVFPLPALEKPEGE